MGYAEQDACRLDLGARWIVYVDMMPYHCAMKLHLLRTALYTEAEINRGDLITVFEHFGNL
jgi:hypothetical protein